MQLAIFNGSPRRSKSNSTLLLTQFLNGYHDTTPQLPIHYLADTKKISSHIEHFEEADTVIIIFPLYTDAMPGQVKFFFEALAPIESKAKNVGFIVQSGFPEAHHSVYIERYLEKLDKRKEWNYIGTVIKGGIEGIQIMPPSMTKKLYNQFYELGKYFAATGKFKPDIVDKLRTPYKLNKRGQFVFRFMKWIGLTNFYWNKKLKENGAFEKRFAQPYAPV